MHIVPERVQQIMRYAVAVAANADDFRQRELGPIHLLKYVYLADLAYARAHDGESYTGIPWRFHHFGPWATEAWEQIQPAMASPGIRHRSFSGLYQDDVSRWSAREPDLEDSVEEDLPHVVAQAVKRGVHEFANDTSGLLHHVYGTLPMLRAAPGERLDLSIVAASPEESTGSETSEESPIPLSKTARKRRKVAHDELRQRFQAALRKRRQRRAGLTVSESPDKDGSLGEVQAWVDSLAGKPMEPLEGELIVSEEVWKSAIRSNPRIP